MNDKQRTALRRKYLREQNRLWPDALIEVGRDKWPEFQQTIQPIKVWRSKTFLVQEYPRIDGAIRLSILRTELDAQGQFMRADIAWEELQRLKAECGYGKHHAVEIYPADADVVNVANMRHLWVMDAPMPFAWLKAKLHQAQK